MSVAGILIAQTNHRGSYEAEVQSECYSSGAPDVYVDVCWLREHRAITTAGDR